MSTKNSLFRAVFMRFKGFWQRLGLILEKTRRPIAWIPPLAADLVSAAAFHTEKIMAKIYRKVSAQISQAIIKPSTK